MHGRDFARERLPNAKVLGAPCNPLSQTDQSRGNSVNRHGGFPTMDVAGEMHLYTPRAIEAPFDRRADYRKFFQSHHLPASYDFDQLQSGLPQRPHERQGGEPDQSGNALRSQFQEPLGPGLVW
jgi:hypothetical protein